MRSLRIVYAVMLAIALTALVPAVTTGKGLDYWVDVSGI